MNDVKLGTVEIAAPARSASLSRTTEFEQNKVNTSTSNSAQPVQSATETSAVENAAEGQQQGTPIAQQNVRDAVTSLNDYVQNIERDLEFSLDDDSGKTVVTVIDKETSEVVRQIPDEVALKLARDLQQDEPLSLFNAKV